MNTVIKPRQSVLQIVGPRRPFSIVSKRSAVGTSAGFTPDLLGTYPRGEAISGARAVRLVTVDGSPKVFLADAMDATKPAHGIVVEAGAADSNVSVWQAVELPGLSGIQLGAYYLGAGGQLVASPPAGAALVQMVGTGVSSSKIFSHIEPPTYLV